VPQGKTVGVTLAFPVDDLKYWDQKKGRFEVPGGDVALAVGSSAKDIHGVVKVTVVR